MFFKITQRCKWTYIGTYDGNTYSVGNDTDMEMAVYHVHPVNPPNIPSPPLVTWQAQLGIVCIGLGINKSLRTLNNSSQLRGSYT